jgi:hypothetical protein
MKKLILTSILFFCVTTTFAQELPEIPMKNGIIYYVFEHKLENKKRCLSDYFKPNKTQLVCYNKISNNLVNFNNVSENQKKGALAISIGASINDLCIDSLISFNTFFILTTKHWGWSPIILTTIFSKKQVKTISATPILNFTSKNEYQLILKDITIKENNYSAYSKNEMSFQSVNELYHQVISSVKISKEDMKFFENLNYFIKSADEIILKSLTDTYQADEL